MKSLIEIYNSIQISLFQQTAPLRSVPFIHLFIHCISALSPQLAHGKRERNRFCKGARKTADRIGKYGPTMCLLIAVSFVGYVRDM